MSLVDPRPGLRAYLLADTTISTLVDSRIYPVQLPQGIRSPSIVYNRISEIESYHMAGPSALMQTRYQFDAIAQSIDDASAVADAIKERLGGFAGDIQFGVQSPPENSMTVEGIFFTNGREDYEGELELYRVSRDYIVWYKER